MADRIDWPTLLNGLTCLMLQADPQPDLIPKDRHTILPKVENKAISEVSLAALA